MKYWKAMKSVMMETKSMMIYAQTYACLMTEFNVTKMELVSNEESYKFPFTDCLAMITITKMEMDVAQL